MQDKEETYQAATYAAILTSLPWIIHSVNVLFTLDLQRFGLHPLQMKGLAGIITLPFLHQDWDHLISNTPSLFLLSFGLFLFYKKQGWEILLLLYLISGLLTWCMGRQYSVHIGASGLIYALAAFHFISGIIKKVPQQMAFALLVSFLYGGFIWAFFPTLYRYTSISWEGHLSGLLTGIALAFYFRRSGPEPPADPFSHEDEEPDNEDEDAYWNTGEKREKGKEGEDPEEVSI